MTAAVAALALAGAGAAPAMAAPAAAAACSGTIDITSLTFDPPAATPGQTVTATIAAQNCTDQPQSASVLVVARFVGSSPGIPAGCPAIDPLPPQTASFAPNGGYTASQGYLIFSGCTATALEVTARFTGAAGALLATRTADLPITAAAPCAVTYRTTSERPSGFTAQVSIANTGSGAVNGWSLAFTYPGDQRITSASNATIRQHGAAVTAGNVAGNASIAPGGTVTFGFAGRWRLSDAAPTSFTLNGAACAVA